MRAVMMPSDLTNYPERAGVLLANLQWAGTVIEAALKDLTEGRPHLAKAALETEMNLIIKTTGSVAAADAEMNRRVRRPLRTVQGAE